MKVSERFLQLRVLRDVPTHLSGGGTAAIRLLNLVVHIDLREIQRDALRRSVISVRSAKVVGRYENLLHLDLEELARLLAGLTRENRCLVVVLTVGALQEQIRTGL